MTTQAKSKTEGALPLMDWQSFDWNLLTDRYGWIAALRDVPQNPVYHAEGDVWIHTGMVARALLALPALNDGSLTPRDKQVLWASALLHDVAKPATTVFDADGVASSPGHAKRGEGMARVILEQEGVASYADREAVCKLVRHHGLPLWFLDKPDTPRALVRASQDVSLRHVALLADADVRGRICADQGNLLDTVALFAETTQELNCWDCPRPFASDHARFEYFRKPDATLDYAAYDDRQFTVTLMCGLPGSGKDTWIAANAADLPVISLDSLRRQMKFAPGEGSAQVAAQGREQARAYLRQHQPFVWNATNLSRLVRQPLIDLCAGYGASVRIVVCHAPIAVALSRNAKREQNAQVPTPVIWNMLDRFEPPSLAECHELTVAEE